MPEVLRPGNQPLGGSREAMPGGPTLSGCRPEIQQSHRTWKVRHSRKENTVATNRSPECPIHVGPEAARVCSSTRFPPVRIHLRSSETVGTQGAISAWLSVGPFYAPRNPLRSCEVDSVLASAQLGVTESHPCALRVGVPESWR